MVMGMMRAGSASYSRGVATTATTAATSLGKWWPTTQPPRQRATVGLHLRVGRHALPVRQQVTLYLPTHANNVLTRTTESRHAMGVCAHQDELEAAPEALSLRRWRTAFDYCGQRTLALASSPRNDPGAQRMC